MPIIVNTNIQHKDVISDTANWIPEENGQFTLASTWEVIRKRNAKDTINNIVWQNNIPLKVSFFIWRSLRGKLPTNEILLKFGEADFDSYCCHRKGKDDINHILITRNFGNYLWKINAARVGAEHELQI